MERASYAVDYNQLTLGCNPVVWKTGTCWIDQRDHVRKRSVPLQSSFGINTKVCSLLLVFSTFPPESSTTNTRADTHTHTRTHTLQQQVSEKDGLLEISERCGGKMEWMGGGEEKV